MQKTKSYSFFISALISLFSFIFAVAIALLLFANAGEYSHASESKTLALALSQELLEQQKEKIERMNGWDLQLLAKEGKIIEESHTKQWDGEERTFSSHVTLSGEQKEQGILIHIAVQVDGEQLNGENENLVHLNTKMYRKM
ncbi:MAG: hypothetical protein Q4D65_01535 [Peptostreptococcaceae bacterium]|nr:hypothetical protein [Peptostreptococcaceae bacterium]